MRNQDSWFRNTEADNQPVRVRHTANDGYVIERSFSTEADAMAWALSRLAQGGFTDFID